MCYTDLFPIIEVDEESASDGRSAGTSELVNKSWPKSKTPLSSDVVRTFDFSIALGPLMIDKHVLLYDMRDPRQARAFDQWRVSLEHSRKPVHVLVLRHWILWPRLRSLAWKHGAAETTIESNGHKVPSLRTCWLDEAPAIAWSETVEEIEMCKCEVYDMLLDFGYDLLGDRKGSVFKHAEGFVCMLKAHSRRILQRADLQRYVKTCGRFDNICKRCGKSSRFFCDHSIVDIGQDRSEALAINGLWETQGLDVLQYASHPVGPSTRHVRVDSKHDHIVSVDESCGSSSLDVV